MQRMSYDDAVAALYQAPQAEFVAERKRLAAELKAAGDKAGAAKLAKLSRPTISAWTVNQLWWQARDDFDALFESADKLRKGDLRASGEHRELMSKLRQRASAILSDAGHGATESTLRRITTTLAALAASGGFDPDPPGTLASDRDPPGFEAVGIAADVPVERDDKPEPPKAKAKAKEPDDKAAREAEEKREQAEAAAERRRKEQAETKRRAEIRQLENSIASAKTEVERKQKDLDRLQKAVESAQAAVEKSRATVDELEAKLAEVAAELAESDD